MMGPDYNYWHGTYELARNFYAKVMPELEELIHDEADSQARPDVAKGQADEPDGCWRSPQASE